MTERISGGSFDVNYDSIMIHVENATVTITDNSAVAQSRGIPNGHTKGSVSADVRLSLTYLREPENYPASNIREYTMADGTTYVWIVME